METRKALLARQTLLSATKPSTTKKWLIVAGAACVAFLTLFVLIGLVGLWKSGVFKVKTKDGTIVFENLPADSVVLVDGEFNRGFLGEIAFRDAAHLDFQFERLGFGGFGLPLDLKGIT